MFYKFIFRIIWKVICDVWGVVGECGVAVVGECGVVGVVVVGKCVVGVVGVVGECGGVLVDGVLCNSIGGFH